MLARLFVLLPFKLAIPEGQEFRLYEYEDEGYKVRMYPPIRSDRPASMDSPDRIEIDGMAAYQADALRIDFWKEGFDRRKDNPLDPPEDVIRRSVNWFLVRLRYVSRAPQVRPLDFPLGGWRIRYLNDDETELEFDESLVRGRGAVRFSFNWITLNKTVWEDIHSLPADYDPPPWDALLLDAFGALPSIGLAIVLAATSLEVFIAHVLDKLAGLGRVDPFLWKWINERGDWLREPTVEEQFDILLKFLAGHSLKEDQKLWEAFKNLKSARNSFVHEGLAKIGGAPVTIEIARGLIQSASQAISAVRQWLPGQLLWPEFNYKFEVKVEKKLT